MNVRRALLIVTGVGLVVAAWRGLPYVRCTLIREQHNPVRHPLGGFKCVDCGHAGADLDEMFPGANAAYVHPLRKVFALGRNGKGESTRTTAFEPTARGW